MAKARFKNMSNYENLGDIHSDRRCATCQGVSMNAYSTVCGCRYCLRCVKAYLNREIRICEGREGDYQIEALDIDNNIYTDLTMNYRISILLVKCRYSCGFCFESSKMEKHERACGNQLANCAHINLQCTETPLVADNNNEHLMGESESRSTLLMGCIDILKEEISSAKRDTDKLRSEIAAMRLTSEIDKKQAKQTEETEQEVANSRKENILISSLKAEIERHRVEYLELETATQQQLSELRSSVETQVRALELLGEKYNHTEERLGELERLAQMEKEELRTSIDALREENGKLQKQCNIQEEGLDEEKSQKEDNNLLFEKQDEPTNNNMEQQREIDLARQKQQEHLEKERHETGKTKVYVPPFKRTPVTGPTATSQAQEPGGSRGNPIISIPHITSSKRQATSGHNDNQDGSWRSNIKTDVYVHPFKRNPANRTKVPSGEKEREGSWRQPITTSRPLRLDLFNDNRHRNWFFNVSTESESD